MKNIVLVLLFSILATACDSKPSQKEIEAKAAAGDTAAQIQLYNLYSSGRAEGGQNNPEAIRWLTKAAEGGNAEAQYSLGSVYSFGYDGVIKNSRLSAKWHETAVMNGNKNSIFLTAMNYKYGWGVQEDPLKAYAYLLVAESFDNKHAKSEDTEFRFSLTQPQREEAESMASEIKQKYFADKK